MHVRRRDARARPDGYGRIRVGRAVVNNAAAPDAAPRRQFLRSSAQGLFDGAAFLHTPSRIKFVTRPSSSSPRTYRSGRWGARGARGASAAACNKACPPLLSVSVSLQVESVGGFSPRRA